MSQVREARKPKLELLHKKLAVASAPAEKKELRSAILKLLDITEQLKGIDFDADDLDVISKLEEARDVILEKLNGSI